MRIKKQSIVFCSAVAGQFFNFAYAQPPGLQGPFIPIEVVSVQPGPDDTVAVIDYYAQTTDYADLYAREADTFEKAAMVGFASDLIGTPWDGATCAALLDAGFVEPCAIPPNLPEDPEKPSEYDWLGSCAPSYGSGFGASDVTLNDCKQRVVDAVESVGGTNVEFNLISCSSGTVVINVTTDFWPGGNNSGFWGPNAPNSYDICVTSTPPPPYDDPEPPTDEELYDIIRPAITTNYFYDYTTQRVINNNTIINNTATSITNNYTTYQGDWMSGDPMVPPDLAPVPLPPAPPVAQPTEQAPGCEAAPNSVGCADADSFVDAVGASVAENLSEEVDLIDGVGTSDSVTSDLSDGLQAVGEVAGNLTFDGGMFDSFSVVSSLLPASTTCQNFEYSLLSEYGMSISIDTCNLEVIRTIIEWILYISTLFALHRIALGKKGEA